MSYNEKQLNEIGRDPIRLRCYFWHVAMNARRIAKSNRSSSRSLSVCFEDGRDLLAEADHMDRFSQVVLDNIDPLVKSSLEQGA